MNLVNKLVINKQRNIRQSLEGKNNKEPNLSKGEEMKESEGNRKFLESLTKFTNQNRHNPSASTNPESSVNPADISRGKSPMSYNKSPLPGSAQQRDASNFVQNRYQANKMMFGKPGGDMGQQNSHFNQFNQQQPHHSMREPLFE